jgi:hypothetical protein
MEQNTTPLQPAERPGQVTAIGILMLVSGLTNAGLFLTWGGIILSGGLATFGLGLFCLPCALPPIALAIFEFIYAAKLLGSNPSSMNSYRTVAILEIVSILFGNVVGLVSGILTLVWLNEPRVQEWFNQNAPIVIQQ